MDKFFRSRIFRFVLCLLLVSFFVINCSPIKAKATSVATAALGTVAFPLAVASGMQALGVLSGTDRSVFSSLVNSCVDALSPTWAVGGLATMLAVNSGGIVKTYASQNFLQAILDWLFSSNTLAFQSSNSKVLTFDGQTFTFTSDVPFLALRWDCKGLGFYMFVSSSAGSVYKGSAKYNMVKQYSQMESSVDYRNGYYTTGASGAHITSDNYVGFYDLGDLSSLPYFQNNSNGWSYRYVCMNYVPALINSPATSYDLTLENVGQEIDTDYDTYVKTGVLSVDFGIQFEDDPNTDLDESQENKDGYVPLRLLEKIDEYYANQTQSEAQSGESQVELDYGSNSGDGSGSGSSGGSGSGGSGSWVPPSDHNKFALGDLSKFFPFCIPFDLFDFFTILNADPVAPVLSWEIKDLAGNTYPISIDLSEWDSVALLFRRLQLLLFITGLAVASRKFIKW